MRFRGQPILLAALVAAALLAGVLLFYCLGRAPGTGDLSVVFLGLTNNPGGSVHPRRFSVVGDGGGLHALFGVTNITRTRHVNFGMDAIETLGTDGWRTNESGSAKQELGHGFSPGYDYRFAISWPAELKADTPWRLRLWVTREPRLLFVKLHHHGYGLRPYGRHTVTSDVVTPLRPVVAEPGTYAGDPQPGGSARGKQPIPSETKGTTLAVRFLTFTNVASTNLAIFALSNTGHRPIEVILPAEIELWKTERNNPGGVCFPTLLSPSSPPLTVRIVPPQTTNQWRVRFYYYPLDSRDRLSRLLGPLGRRIGRQAVATTSQAHGEWMPPTIPVQPLQP